MLKESVHRQLLKQEHSVKELQSRVFQHMLKTRGLKYRAFLWQLRSFKYLAFAPLRGDFLESYYTLMRYLDDIVDGDAPLSDGYPSETAYISEKIQFLKNPHYPKDEVDYLMLHCFELAAQFGEDFRSETKDILGCLLFDSRRRRKHIVFQRAELVHHFYLLDIRGTIRATLKIFNDDPDKFKLLEPLGMACRYQFNIEDFEDDITAGYINISREDCDDFDITLEDLQQMAPNVKAWLRCHAEGGMALLAKHHSVMPLGNFSLFEKIVFKVVYELPARRAFRKILSESTH